MLDDASEANYVRRTSTGHLVKLTVEEINVLRMSLMNERQTQRRHMAPITPLIEGPGIVRRHRWHLDKKSGKKVYRVIIDYPTGPPPLAIDFPRIVLESLPVRITLAHDLNRLPPPSAS